MNDLEALEAANCLENLRLSVSPAEFGYKVQALAAHVLLRLNFEVEKVNRLGHPDIVAIRGMDKFHFEIEAEVAAPRLRQLTEEDFSSLTELQGGVGYFALAISFPTPRWIVVQADRLKHRKPSSNVLLEALSDIEFSNAWTSAYVELLRKECRRISRVSFRDLCERATLGRGF
jgi:hypothetical protein